MQKSFFLSKNHPSSLTVSNKITRPNRFRAFFRKAFVPLVFSSLILTTPHMIKARTYGEQPPKPNYEERLRAAHKNHITEFGIPIHKSKYAVPIGQNKLYHYTISRINCHECQDYLNDKIRTLRSSGIDSASKVVTEISDTVYWDIKPKGYQTKKSEKLHSSGIACVYVETFKISSEKQVTTKPKSDQRAIKPKPHQKKTKSSDYWEKIFTLVGLIANPISF